MEKPISKSGMIIIILASLAGLLLTLFAVNNSINASKTKSWPTTEGTIYSSEVVRSSRYVPKIVYTYNVDTNAYSSERIRLKDMAQYKKKVDAEKVANKYPVDSKVKVYYNPIKFDEAILDPGIKGEHIFMLLIGLIIFIAPLIGLIYSIRKAKQS